MSIDNNNLPDKQNNQLKKVGNYLNITNKLLANDIAKQFNEAFYALFNLKNKTDYYTLINNGLIDCLSLDTETWANISAQEIRESSDRLSQNIILKRCIAIFTKIIRNEDCHLAFHYRALAKVRLCGNIYNEECDAIELFYAKAITTDTYKNLPDAMKEYHEDDDEDLQNAFYQTYEKKEEAIEDYSNAIRINPSFFISYNNRGEVSQLLPFGHHEHMNLEPIEDFTKAIALYSKFAEAYNNRGKAKRYADLDGAMEEFSSAIKINPKFAEAYINRAECRRSKKDYQGAIEDYTKAIEIDPTKEKSYINRAECRRSIKDYQGAIEDSTILIKISLSKHEFYSLRGTIKREIGDSQGAIEDFTKQIETCYHQYGKQYYERGKVYFDRAESNMFSGFKEKADKDFIKAIKDFEESLPILENFIFLFRDSNNHDTGDHQKRLDHYNYISTATMWLNDSSKIKNYRS